MSLRVQQLNVTCETKTSDSVFVTLQVSIQYQVRSHWQRNGGQQPLQSAGRSAVKRSPDACAAAHMPEAAAPPLPCAFFWCIAQRVTWAPAAGGPQVVPSDLYDAFYKLTNPRWGMARPSWR